MRTHDEILDGEQGDDRVAPIFQLLGEGRLGREGVDAVIAMLEADGLPSVPPALIERACQIARRPRPTRVVPVITPTTHARRCGRYNRYGPLMMFDASAHLLDRLRSALLAAGLGPTHLDIAPADDPEGRTLAAGLVLLYPYRLDGSADRPVVPHLVLTRRTTAMRRHSGQISLPGGRYDAEDGSLLRTALRETDEELGVDPANLTIWGRLEPEHIVASHYALAPFVAYTPRRPAFVPAPAEVAEVIDVPLALLLNPETVEEENWDFQGRTRRVSFYRYREHKIWGATARVLSQVVALLDPPRAAADTFVGAAGETGRPRLAPGDVWPRSVRQPS